MKKKRSGIFIDLRNKEQVEWWNKKASKLVKVENCCKIMETSTRKVVGILLGLKPGIFVNHVVRNNVKFINNPKKIVYKIES